MQDAVILANCLYDLESLEPQHIQAALEDYRDQRHPKVEEIYQKSKTTAALSYGQVIKKENGREMKTKIGFFGV